MIKNIVFIITDITKMAGTERTTITLCNALFHQGYSVEIISLFRENREIVFELESSVRVRYALDYAYAVGGGFVRMKHLLLAFKGLKRLFRESREDVIVAQCFLPAFLIWLCGRAKKSIVCEHFKYDMYPSLICRFRDSVYGRFRYMVLLTDEEKEKYAERIKYIEVIPNIAPFTNMAGLADLNGRRIITVGRLTYQKGYDMLLEAARKIFKEHPDWRLDIYGDGELKEHLLRLRDKNGVENFITFKGQTKFVCREMLQSSIFVLSSRYEGMPMVLLEAMGCGLPIVAFDCPTGPSGLLSGGAGVLVEPDNIEKLADAVLRLIKDAELRRHYALQGIEKVKEFSPVAVSLKWKELFYKMG